MPNINVQADYFLPIILECTLIASKKINRAIYIHWTSTTISHIGPNVNVP